MSDPRGGLAPDDDTPAPPLAPPPAEASEAPADPPGTKLFGTAAEGDDARPAADTADSDKLAKPE